MSRLETKNYSMLIPITLAIVLIAAILYFPNQKILSENEKENEAHTLLNTVYDSTKASKTQAIVKHTKSETKGSAFYDIYFAEYDLPEDVSEKIPQDFKPYVNNSGVRILASRKDNKDGNHRFCKIDDDRQIECITIAAR